MRDGRLTSEVSYNLFHILILSLLAQIIHNLLSFLNTSFCLGHDQTHITFDQAYLLMLFVAVYAQTFQESLEEHICVVELTVLDQQNKRQFARNVAQQFQ